MANDIEKKRNLTWHLFFNYCAKTDLVHLDELRDHLNNSDESVDMLLFKLLGVFNEWLPEEEFLIVRKDLTAVAEKVKDNPCDDLSKYVTCIPAWEGWTEEERIILHYVENYIASNLSIVVIKILLGQDL